MSVCLISVKECCMGDSMIADSIPLCLKLAEASADLVYAVQF